MDIKRLFDILLSLAGIILLIPFTLIVMICLIADSPGPIFYTQVRVGLNSKCFWLIKFRTMCTGAEKRGLLTVGKDNRITAVGAWLRKYKVDELPQLINILKGEMSFVGPRPEVPHYVDMYDDGQRRVLTVRPGITDWASIRYIRENDLLAGAEDPEAFYIQTVMPSKISQNLHYIDHHDLWTDCKIISHTIKNIFIQ
jgi:lipopolysaccharide/colanic/teichoic acid biosynthesis glycosyltransferase